MIIVWRPYKIHQYKSVYGARFLTLDIKDFILQTEIGNKEYMRIHNKYFIGEMLNKYNIDKLQQMMVSYIVESKKVCTDYARLLD